MNPPPEKWTGAVVVAGQIVRGNTRTDDLSIDVDAMLRRNNEVHNDRTTLQGAYNLGLVDSVTTTDNWFVSGKYDYFFDPKLYGYGLVKLERDRIANLDYRVSPGVGLGYQWIESPEMNFNTEAGVSYVHEEYRTGGTDDTLAARLAYHFDKKLHDKLSVFHNFEIVPGWCDPHDFNLTTDAGIRADLTATFFAQFKVEWKHDSTPAPGSGKNDYRYLLGIGWRF
jgi:putative salt-induced outer membrane protein YdiY